MLFPTLKFALFFALVLGVSWRLNDRPKIWKPTMLAASYVFYAAWDWKFLGLIILSSVVNSGVAVAIFNSKDRARRAWLIVGLVFNLGLLGYFKYWNFFTDGLVALLKPLGLAPTGLLADVGLPIAISFFTFQGISYIVDVYRREIEPYALMEVALYLAFFPHLVAGPIVRAQEFVPQLRRRRNPQGVDVSRAVRLIGRGLVKKVIVATVMGEVVDQVFAAPGNYHALTVLVAIWAYAIQIYADFSGYTDMAIGIALLLGFKFPQNFDRPYAAVSIQQFWRRWHITLSNWLRDYLYIPLGGNKNNKTNRNLVITMALGGLWHGASWVFVLWGVYHGCGLALERTYTARRESGQPIFTVQALRDRREKARTYQASLRGEIHHPAADDETVEIADAAATWAGDRSTAAMGAASGGRSESGSGPGRGGPGRVERWVRRHTDEIEFDEEWNRLRKSLEDDQRPRGLHPLIKTFFVFQFVCLGWVFFRAADLGSALGVLGRLFTGWGSGEMAITGVVAGLIVVSLAAQFMPRYVGDLAEYKFSRLAPIYQALAFGAFLSLVQVLGPQGVAPFIYFQF